MTEEISGMPVFKSYMPIKSGFDELVKTSFNHLSDGEKRLLEMVFFAGASSACNAITNHPLGQETVFDELVDHADRMAREKVA